MSQHTRLAKKKRVSSLFRRFIKEHGSQSICSLQVQSGLLSRFISNEFARLFRLHNINQDGVHDRKKDRKTVMGDSISNSQVFQFFGAPDGRKTLFLLILTESSDGGFLQTGSSSLAQTNRWSGKKQSH